MAPRAASNPTPPSEVFIRFILPYSIHRGTLTLPDYFSRRYGRELSEKVTITSPDDGAEWTIGLKKKSPLRMFLAAGWPDFMAAHSIKLYYILVFEYLGDSRFRLLQIFNRSCCLHRLLQQPTNGRKSTRGRKAGSGASGSRNSAEEKNPRNDGGLMMELLDSLAKQGTFMKGSSIETAPLTDESKRFAKEMMKRELQHPSFIVQVAESSKLLSTGLLVPGRFTRMHTPGFIRGAQTTKIGTVELCSGRRGKRWVVGIYASNSKSFYLRRGMSKFARGNSLKEGDLCLFELLAMEPLELRASIFRVSE